MESITLLNKKEYLAKAVGSRSHIGLLYGEVLYGVCGNTSVPASDEFYDAVRNAHVRGVTLKHAKLGIRE